MNKKFKRRKVSARLKDNIWAENLPEMKALFSINQAFDDLLYVIDSFAKYDYFKMSKMVNNFLLVGDKCIPKLHLRKLAFTYTCGSCT